MNPGEFEEGLGRKARCVVRYGARLRLEWFLTNLCPFLIHGPGAQSVANGSKFSSGETKLEDLSGESMEFHVDGGRLVSDGEEGISNMGSPGVSAANDIFWEQFLSETPSAADQELSEQDELDLAGADISKEEDGDETVGDPVEVLGEILLGDEDGGDPKDWWSKKPGSVDQLSFRMGQLAPG